MPNENTFITIPKSLAEPLFTYLESRANMVRSRAKEAADEGNFERSLALGNLTNALLVSRSLAFADFKRSEIAAKETGKPIPTEQNVVKFNIEK